MGKEPGSGDAGAVVVAEAAEVGLAGLGLHRGVGVDVGHLQDPGVDLAERDRQRLLLHAGLDQRADALQQAVADQAFTNAKAAGDLDGMVNALIFRAIERNTGGVGVKSALCTQTAKNPEVAALTQHQDPASTGAAATRC